MTALGGLTCAKASSMFRRLPGAVRQGDLPRRLALDGRRPAPSCAALRARAFRSISGARPTGSARATLRDVRRAASSTRMRPAGRAVGQRQRVGAVTAAARTARALGLAAASGRKPCSSGSGGASSGTLSAAERPPDQIEQRRDGDLQDHHQEEDRKEAVHVSQSLSRECIRRAPRLKSASVWASVIPMCDSVGHEQRRRGAARRPGVTALVEGVVDPGERPLAGVLARARRASSGRCRSRARPSKVRHGKLARAGRG